MKRLLKVFSTVIIFYVIVKVTDISRGLIIASILGVSVNADIYLGVLNIPDLLLILVGFDSIKGILNSEFSALKAINKYEELWNSYAKLFYIFTILGLILLAVFIILRNNVIDLLLPGFSGPKKELAVNIFLIITPVFFIKIIFSLSQSVSNAFQKYYIPIIIPSIINFTILGSLLFTHINDNVIYNLAYGVTAGNIIVIIIMLVYNSHLGAIFKITDLKPDQMTLRVLKSVSLMAVLVIINQLFFASRNFFASFMPDGSVSVLNYATMVSNIFSVFIFTVFFNVLLSETSTLLAEKKNEEAKSLFFNITLSIFFFIIPIVSTLLVCRVNILELVFLRGNFSKEKINLLFSPYLWECLALMPFVVFICCVSLYLSAKKYKLLSQIGIPVFIFGILLNYILSKYIGLYGLSMSYFIIGVVYGMLLLAFSRRFIGAIKEHVFNLIKMLIAGVIVFVLVAFVNKILKFDVEGSIGLNILFISCVFLVTFLMHYLITIILKVNYFKRIIAIFMKA